MFMTMRRVRTFERGTGKRLADKSESLKKRIVMASIAVLLLFLVVLGGWYQWAHRARRPIDLIKQHVSRETGRTIDDAIEGFIRQQGTEIVGTGFKPSWGAEEVGDNEYIVAYVYEVGRESNWISWRVSLPSGEVTPLDDWANELWR